VYVSKIEDAFIAGGQTVYIVIDGYGGDCGEYIMDVTADVPPPPCIIDCGAAELEGEPPLVDGYADEYNGGCNSPEFGNPFQDLFGTGNNELALCGKGGWYDGNTRDTDWFTVVLQEGGAGFIELVLDAEQESYLFELGPQDCGSVGVLQNVLAGPCSPSTMTIFGEPGDLVWIWVGASTFAPPPGFVGNEYTWLLTIEGLEDGIIATQDATWSDVKGLYR
jgi:hypothetical protein